MATGAAQMKALTRQLGRVPDQAVTDLLEWMVPRSQQIGGRMMWFGKKRRLTIKVKKRRKAQRANVAVIQGVPVSCWSIKSYGRRGDYWVRPRRAEALSIKGAAPGVMFEQIHIQRGTSGDRRWNRLVAEAQIRFPDIVGGLVRFELNR
jgi:hypothetical protein